LNNSTSSSLEYMKPLWQKLRPEFNTVLTPLSWELSSLKKGNSISTLSMFNKEARRIICILFFMAGQLEKRDVDLCASLAKEHYKEYPRAKIQRDSTIEVFSAFSQVNMEADSKAFSALMKHIREVDAGNHNRPDDAG